MNNNGNIKMLLNNNYCIYNEKKSQDIYSNNPQKYNETKSIYEFFILSLIKNINIKKQTAISLVLDFHKNNFIKIFFNKQTNKNTVKDYTLLLSWVKDIKNNYNIIQSFFDVSKNKNDIKNHCYKIISIGLYTDNIEIVSMTNSIIEYMTKKNKVHLDWFVTEGYLIYINNINTFSLIRISLLKCLIEMIKENENIFFQMIKSDLININLKEQIKLFIENCFQIKDEDKSFNLLKNKLFIALEEIYFDHNLSLNEKDIPLIINLITFGWIENPNIFIVENNIIINNKGNDHDTSKLKNIILILFQENIFNNYNINCICSIIDLFLLLNKFGKIKNEDGPLIYKTLVYQFINQFENEFKKEIFLENFLNFFFTNLKFPIDLFLSPYLEKIYKTQIITLYDFNFISTILSHPRFTCENAFEIIYTLLDFSFNDNLYTKCISMIINLIFSLNLLTKNEIIYEKSQEKLTSYIIEVLNFYKEKVVKNIINDNIYYKNLLEIVYCIMIKKFGNVNNNIIELLINIIDEYRNIYANNSNELLKLLWIYDIYDDVLLQLEEKYYHINSNKNISIKVNDVNKEIIKPNTSIIFQKVKKINIRKDKKNQNIIIRNKKSIDELNREMIQKVENDLKKINDNQKNHILLEKQKEKLLLTKESITKQRLKKIFNRRSLFLGISKNKNQRSNSSNHDKRDGFILEEGDGEMPYPYRNLIYKRKNSKMKLNILLINNRYKFIVNYFEEEKREIKGIEALNQKYKNEIKILFNKLIDNYDTISKSNIMKYLRENEITNKDLTLDELSLCVKNSFPDKNLVYFNENEFKKLLIILSYYIMNKKNNNYTLFESYDLFLKKILKNIQDNESRKNPKYSKIKQYLLNNLDINNGKINILLPPGFKVVQKVNINLIKRFPNNLNKLFSESKIICYSILDEIILKALKCSHGILENYIKIEKVNDIEIDSGKIKPWSHDLTIAYTKLPKQYNIIGIEVASILEEGLRKISLGKNIELKSNILNNSLDKDKIDKIIVNHNKIKIFKKKIDKPLIKREKTEIKNNEKITLFNDIKNKEVFLNIKKQNRSHKKDINKAQKLILGSNTIKYKKFNNISEIKLKDDNKKMKYKILDRNNKKLNNIRIIKEKKIKSKIFLTEQNKKIKEELQKIIKNRKLKELKKRNLSEKLLIPKINSNYFNDNKEYIELDKKLINNIKKIIDNNSKINYYLSKYNLHLKLIFGIYHKIGLNSISSINSLIDNSLCYNEYKEFLINFGILNVFISIEQMNFIFKRLSRQNNTGKIEKYNFNIIKNKDTLNYKQKTYFTFDDFKISLLLIIIFSNMENDNIQIMKNDYENLNEKSVELLFDYLELIIPFYRRDIEDMVNKRRNMNSKCFKEWKKKKKNDLLNIFNNLYLNEDNYSILLKKIKNKSDILPYFSETKISKVGLENQKLNEKKKEYIHYSNNIHLKKLKIKNKINKKSINLKYSKSFEENRKTESKIIKTRTKKDIINSNELKNKKTNTENSDDMLSIDFSLSYTNSTHRDKENGSNETNINNDTNTINKSEFINFQK